VGDISGYIHNRTPGAVYIPVLNNGHTLSKPHLSVKMLNVYVFAMHFPVYYMFP